MRKNLIIALLSTFLMHTLSAEFVSTEEEISKRVHAHLLIRDYHGALENCKVAQQAFPKSKLLQAGMIRALCESGQSQEALGIWKKYLGKTNLDLKEEFFLIESLAWGVLKSADHSSEKARFTALVGAFYTNDARAVKMIMSGLRSSNAMLRQASIRMATKYKDHCLQQEFLRMIKEERNWFVRLDLIGAIGQIGLKEAIGYLEDILARGSASHEEKFIAIQSIVQLYEDISLLERKLLLTSKRAGLRQLALEAILHLDLIEAIEEILPLLNDPTLGVRLHALKALGSMEIPLHLRQVVHDAIRPLVYSQNPLVSITSSGVLSRFGKDEGIEKLKVWIKGKDPLLAQVAAAVLTKCGALGAHVMPELFLSVEDSFVKANLAVGMLIHHEEVDVAYAYLWEFMNNHKGRLMWDEKTCPFAKILARSEVRHVPHIPSYPHVVDQLTRLELVNMLTVAGSGNAKELIRDFLTSRAWGVCGNAAILLLGEADLEAADLVKELVNDKDEKIAIQAALALAYLRGDKGVTSRLESAYAKVDWDVKLSILEALGRIGNRDSIPFLLKEIEQPFQNIRMGAASAIIQCLYH